MKTIHDLSQLSPTPAMLVNSFAAKLLDTQLTRMSRNLPPLPRKFVRATLDPFWARDPATATAIKTHEYYLAALWLAKRPTKHHTRKAA